VTASVVATNTLTVAVDAGPLAVVGGAAFVTSSAGNVLVARTGQDTFSALSSICTHEQCNVSMWSSPQFVCPCHGSEYATDGTVVRGPAARNLTRFGTSVANNVLTITA
jgi:Rieske Fe-S protein